LVILLVGWFGVWLFGWLISNLVGPWLGRAVVSLVSDLFIYLFICVGFLGIVRHSLRLAQFGAGRALCTTWRDEAEKNGYRKISCL
jgi:hypothetical protein